MGNTSAEPLDQLLFRWEGNRTQYVTGIAAAAYSCDDQRAEDLRALLAPLLRVEGTGSRRSSLVRRLVPETGEAVLIHRRPALDARGRESTVSRALVGSPQVLTGRESISLAATKWEWTGLSDDVTGRIDPLPVDVLRQRFDAAQPQYVDKIAIVGTPLEVAVAQLLRTPGHRLTFLRQDISADEQANYAPLLIWGLCAMLGPWLGDDLFTFASFDTQEHAGLRLVCVPEWPRSAMGGSAAQRITFADAVRDDARVIAAELVRLFLADPARPDRLMKVLEACSDPRKCTQQGRLDALARALRAGPPRLRTGVTRGAGPVAPLPKGVAGYGDVAAVPGVPPRLTRNGTAPAPESGELPGSAARPGVPAAESAGHAGSGRPVSPMSGGADPQEGTEQRPAPYQELLPTAEAGTAGPGTAGPVDTPAPVSEAPSSAARTPRAPETRASETQTPQFQTPDPRAPQPQTPQFQAPQPQTPEPQTPESPGPESRDPAPAPWQGPQAPVGLPPGYTARAASAAARPGDVRLPEPGGPADRAGRPPAGPAGTSADEPSVPASSVPASSVPVSPAPERTAEPQAATGGVPTAQEQAPWWEGGTGEGAQARHAYARQPVRSGPDPMGGRSAQGQERDGHTREWDPHDGQGNRHTGEASRHTGEADRHTGEADLYSGEADRYTEEAGRYDGASFAPQSGPTAPSGARFTDSTAPPSIGLSDPAGPRRSPVDGRTSAPPRPHPGPEGGTGRGERPASHRTGYADPQLPVRVRKLRRLGKWVSPLWWQQRPRAQQHAEWILSRLGDPAGQGTPVPPSQIADELRRLPDEELCDALGDRELDPRSAVRLLTALEERTPWRTLDEAVELAANLLDQFLYLRHPWRAALVADGDVKHGGTAGAVRMFRWAVRPYARDARLREGLERLAAACGPESDDAVREFWRQLAFDSFDPPPDLLPTVWQELGRTGPWQPEAPRTDRAPAPTGAASAPRRRSTRAAHRTPPDDSRKAAFVALALTAVLVLLVLLLVWVTD
ncbi:hypothetical protein [Streptomyces sp. NPDC093094]|uniref:hypothetical protein n=1 Tax=Streptomyces sp. NPDC093094 TaxID=3366026 RepID=UPI00382DA027